ncbi:hypothetical protein T06_15729 [Trichinella sp. T6]|nr:hypothetical protein T06_15729 [Trichinella sp. T6]
MHTTVPFCLGYSQRVARDSVVVANFSWHQGVSNVASQTSDALSQTKRYSVAVLPPCSRYLGNKCKLGKILFVSISGHCGAAECFSVSSKMAAIKQRLTSCPFAIVMVVMLFSAMLCHSRTESAMDTIALESFILSRLNFYFFMHSLADSLVCISGVDRRQFNPLLHLGFNGLVLNPEFTRWFQSYHSGCIICRNAPDDSPPDP